MKDQEVFKDVSGYEGSYQVSNLGRVKSLERTRLTNKGGSTKVNERILYSNTDSNGYEYVSLSKGGTMKSLKVHRLVGLCFIPNPENKPQINHKNGIKSDNNYHNLEWCTCRENAIHAFQLGLRLPNNYWLGKTGSLHNKSIPVSQYTLDGEFIKSYGSMREAEREAGTHGTLISKVCNGIYKQAGGFKWEYKLN